MLRKHTSVSVLVYLMVFSLTHAALRWLCELLGRDGFTAGSLCALAAVGMAELVESLYLCWRARREAAREAAFSFLD